MVLVSWFKDGRRVGRRFISINSADANGYVDLDLSVNGSSCVAADFIEFRLLFSVRFLKLDNLEWSSNVLDHSIITNDDFLFSKDFTPHNVNYQWLDCDNGCSDIPSETNRVFEATSNGRYAVRVSDNECSFTTDRVRVNNNFSKSNPIVETFESGHTAGASAFSNNGNTFTLSNWSIDNFEYFGLDTTDWYVDNYYSCVGNNPIFSISGLDNFYFNGAWILPSNDCGNPTDGTVRISWYDNGELLDSEEYDLNNETKVSWFLDDNPLGVTLGSLDNSHSNSYSNGFIHLDLESDRRSEYYVDSVTIELLGDLNYLSIDNFSWSTRQNSPAVQPRPNTAANTTDNAMLTVEEATSERIQIYPNPIEDYMAIQHPEIEGGTVYVTNVYGASVLTSEANGTETRLNTSSLASGVYIVTIEATNYSDRITIMK